jgi:hypothetical protein
LPQVQIIKIKVSKKHYEIKNTSYQNIYSIN